MTMRRKTSQIKTKYDINFYQFSKIKCLKYKFEGNSFFKFLKNAKKNVIFIFQKLIFLNYTFHTRI